jgi:hypothetical protein
VVSSPPLLFPDNKRHPFLMRVGLLLLIMAGGFLLLWQEFGAPARKKAKVEHLIRTIRTDPVLLEAIRSQNHTLAQMTQEEIETIDRQWIAEKGGAQGHRITDMRAHPASHRLQALLRGSGVASHAILMDDKGRTVAMAATTTDWFQGDEAKWLQTFGRGPDTRHVSAPEPIHDGRALVVRWISVPLADPQTSLPLGAISLEVLQ